MYAFVKILFRSLLKFALVVLVSILVYFIAATLLSYLSTNPTVVTCQERHEIFITSNGVHTDIIFPVHLIEKSLLRALDVPGQVNYLSFGWGDRDFYLKTPTWDQFNLWIALKAVFLKGKTVIHVTQYYRPYDSWQSIPLCETQIQALMNYINNSFQKNEEGQIIGIGQTGYGRNDHFYNAHGNFSFLKTCNNWVNLGLKEAGVKTAIWSPFTFGIMQHVRQKEVRH